MKKESFISYLEQSIWLAVFVVIIFGYNWVDEILLAWGYEGFSFFSGQIFIGFGLWLLVMIAVFVVNYGLYRAGIEKTARIGAWLAALFAPRVGKIATEEWNPFPVQDEIIAILILLVFVVGYWIEKKRTEKSQRRRAGE